MEAVKHCDAIDLFAGAGGWDLAAVELGLDVLGIEFDDAACATRAAAGLRTVKADIVELDPTDYQPASGPLQGLIASPPCQAWSMAGKRAGERDKGEVVACAHEIAAGGDTRAERRERCEDDRSMLVVEPLRWVRDLEPQWVALEQVPPVLELWSLFAGFLRVWGYHVWTGGLSAERYGVPQTRRRAILLAHRDRPVCPPEPTHQEYVPGEPARHEVTLLGEVLPWVSMATALGWHEDDEIEKERGAGMLERHGDRRPRKGSEPSPTVTGGTKGSGPRIVRRPAIAHRPAPTIVTTRRSDEGIIVGRQLPEGEGRNVGGRNWKPDTLEHAQRNGSTGEYAERKTKWVRDDGSAVNEFGSVEELAPCGCFWGVVDAGGFCACCHAHVDDPNGLYAEQGDGTHHHRDCPANRQSTPASTAELQAEDWPEKRPATPLAGDERVFQPGGHHQPGQQSENAIRVTLEEASILQSFPADYPWQGSKSARYLQVGNAVPPLLARAVLGQVAEAREAVASWGDALVCAVDRAPAVEQVARLYRQTGRDLGSRGGKVELPDGSVVEVEETSWERLMAEAGLQGPTPPTASEQASILTEWHARHGVRAGGGEGR